MADQAPYGLVPGDNWFAQDEAFATDMIGAPALMPGSLIPRAAGATLSAGALKPYKGPADEAMLAVHNTRPDRLAKADQLGGFAVPSIAVVKPSHGFSSFGDVSLVVPHELITPARGNPVFGSDVYSPRFPSLNDEGTKIFRGFTDAGNRRYAPLTMDNLVREMKGNIRGGESFNYGAGSVRAAVTPQFGSARELQAARDKIVTKEEFDPLKAQTNEELVNLAHEFHPYSKYSGNSFQHTDDFASMLAEPGGIRNLTEHYKNPPPELIDRARAFLNNLRDMPTQYFEAKPQRAVRIGEFSGAVVPESEMATVGPILDKHGIKRVEQYGGDTEEIRNAARRAALLKFPEHFFAAPIAAGAAWGSLAPDRGD